MLPLSFKYIAKPLQRSLITIAISVIVLGISGCNSLDYVFPPKSSFIIFSTDSKRTPEDGENVITVANKSVSDSKGLITIKATDTDIREFLAQLAELSGERLGISNNIEKKINIDVTDTPWMDVIYDVAKQGNLVVSFPKNEILLWDFQQWNAPIKQRRLLIQICANVLFFVIIGMIFLSLRMKRKRSEAKEGSKKDSWANLK